MPTEPNAVDGPTTVSFIISRNAATLDPFTTIEEASRQAYTEHVVRPLVVAGAPDAINFYYRTERYGDDLDVSLVIYGQDELLVRQAAQTLDAHHHPEQAFYEEQIDEDY